MRLRDVDLRPTAPRMPPCGDQTGAPPNSALVGTLTLSDLAPHHLEPEGQSAVMAGSVAGPVG